MKTATRWVLSIPLLLGLLSTSCGGEVAHAEPSLAVVPIPPRPIEEGKPTVWWIHVGEQSSASFWLGPVMTDGMDVTRLWTLVCHVPGYDRPLACRHDRVPAEGTDPVVLEAPDIGVSIQPADGRTWADVYKSDHLVTSIRGFY